MCPRVVPALLCAAAAAATSHVVDIQLRVRIAIGVVVSLAVVSLLIGISAVRKRKKRGLPHAASDDSTAASTHSSDAFVPTPPIIHAR